MNLKWICLIGGGCIAAAVTGWMVRGVDGLNILGTIASIVGLGFSIYVTLLVGEIRRGYVSHAMLKTGLERLLKHRKNLGIAIDRNDQGKVRIHLASCKGLLLELIPHLPKEHNFNSLAIDIQGLLDNSSSTMLVLRAADLQSSIDELIERFRMHQMRMEWGGNDE